MEIFGTYTLERSTRIEGDIWINFGSSQEIPCKGFSIDNILIEREHTFATSMAIGLVESVPVELFVSFEIINLSGSLIPSKRISFASLLVIHIVEVGRHIGIVRRIRILRLYILNTGITYLSKLIAQV